MLCREPPGPNSFADNRLLWRPNRLSWEGTLSGERVERWLAAARELSLIAVVLIATSGFAACAKGQRAIRIGTDVDAQSLDRLHRLLVLRFGRLGRARTRGQGRDRSGHRRFRRCLTAIHDHVGFGVDGMAPLDQFGEDRARIALFQ